MIKLMAIIKSEVRMSWQHPKLIFKWPNGETKNVENKEMEITRNGVRNMAEYILEFLLRVRVNMSIGESSVPVVPHP